MAEEDGKTVRKGWQGETGLVGLGQVGWLAGSGGRPGGGWAGWDGWPGDGRGVDLRSKECSGVKIIT